MTDRLKTQISFLVMFFLLIAVGIFQSWSLSLAILNLCLISAIMALGVNIQWGYAGLINIGVMGFVAVGGLAAVLVSQPPVLESWSAGGYGIILSLFIVLIVVAIIFLIRKKIKKILTKRILIFLTINIGLVLLNKFYDPAVSSIDAINPAKTGFFG